MNTNGDSKANGSSSPHASFCIGEWLIQPGAGRISKDAASARVEPKVMEVLLCLAKQPGETVSRDYLLETLWADTFVTEDVLNRSISKLRKIFRDDPKAPAIIETIPKVGYRLIAPVSFDQAAVASHNGLDLSARPSTPTQQTESSIRPARRFRAGQSLALIVALVMVAAFFWWRWKTTESGNPPSRTDVQIVPFTTSPGYEVAPTFSPDGEQIAFAWRGETGDNWDIYSKAVAAEIPQRLTNHPARELNPAFSPDGRSLAFIRTSETECGIYTVTTTGNSERKITDCNVASAPEITWSPDNQWIAYTDRISPQAPHNIFFVSTTSGEKRQQTSSPSQTVGDGEVAFSPDGRTLAFTRSTALGVEDIYLLPTPGGEPRRLTFDNLKVHGLAWMPDGKTILYASNRGGSFSLWQIATKGGAPEWVAAGGKNAEEPAISSSGQLLVYEQWLSDTNIWQMNLASGKAAATSSLIASTQWDWNPQFSPDGKRIAFISDRSGASEIWIADASGANPTRVTSFNGPYARSLRWSPDGQALAFDISAEGNFDVYVVAATGGAVQRMTKESSEEAAVNWSRDGRWLYFASNRNGAWQVWKVSASGGEAVQVTEGGGFASAESRDGQWLYYTKQEVPGIWRMKVDGSEATLLVDNLEPVDASNWIVTDTGIYFTDRAVPDQPQLAFFDLASKQTRAINALPRLLYKSGLSLSPDGQSLLYTRIDKSEADLILVKNFR